MGHVLVYASLVPHVLLAFRFPCKLLFVQNSSLSSFSSIVFADHFQERLLSSSIEARDTFKYLRATARILVSK